MKQIQKFAFAIVMILAISMPLSTIGGVKAAAAGTISFTLPPSAADLPLGSTFTMTAQITGGSDVWQWVLEEITWDPAVLEMMSYSEGNYLNSVAATLFAGAPVSSTKTTGVLTEVSDSFMMLSNVANGDGVLATFTFKVVGFGDTNIYVDGNAFLQDNVPQETQLTPPSVAYVGADPPPPYGPTAVMASIPDFIAEGSSITLDGSASLPGFDGANQVDITTYAWTVEPLGFTSAAQTPGTLPLNDAGEYTITLTVTAPGATPETNTVSKTVTVVPPASGPSIDVYTQRGGEFAGVSSDAFGPQENVELTAVVTYNNAPVAGQRVAFEIQKPNGDAIAYRAADTNEDGIATTSYRLPWPAPDENPEDTFGTWSIVATVELPDPQQGTELYVVDDVVSFNFDYILKTTTITTLTMQNQPASTFARDNQLKIRVDVRNIANSEYTGTVTITIYDECNVPVAVETVDLPIDGVDTDSAIETLSIPLYAYVGTATVYVNVLTQLPSLGGVPFCPETSKNFQISVA